MPVIKWREVTEEGQPLPNVSIPYSFNTDGMSYPPHDGHEAAEAAILECLNECAADWPDREYYIEILEPAEFTGLYEVIVDYDPVTTAYSLEPKV